MTDDDARPGFDRRALIKKGLVAGGIAATVPVITTFNTAAYAASVPGCHRKMYLVSTQGQTISVGEVAPTNSTTCDPSSGSPSCVWASVTSTVPTVTVSINQGTDVVTLLLNGSYSSCEIVAGSAIRTNGTSCQNPLTLAAGAFGTNTVSWFVPSNQDWHVRLLIFC